MTTTASHPVFDKLETPDHVFVFDVAGLEALPEGTELIDADQTAFMVWTKSAQGFRYHHMAQRERKGATWTASELAYAAEKNGWMPFEVVNPEIFGEFAPVVAQQSKREKHPNDGRRARLINSWAGFVGRWNGLEVRIVQWDYGNKCAIVQPLTPRPDRWGMEEFTWNTRNIELIDGPTRTPLEDLDDLPNGTVIRLRSATFDAEPLDAVRVKRNGEWQSLAGVCVLDGEELDVRNSDWTNSTRHYVTRGMPFEIEYRAVFA